MQDFRQLRVWQAAHELTLTVYRLARPFPREEAFGLTSQMRRASCSIGSNIAEGCGRGGDADFARFLQTAMGSACELEYQLLLSRDLDLIGAEAFEQVELLVSDVKKMLVGLLQKLRGSPHRQVTEPTADTRQRTADS